MAESVDRKVYSQDYFLERCGGVEFFKKYGTSVLKPAMQSAVLAATLSKHHKILDVGCGRGELVAHLTQKGFDATGIDYSEDAIKIAKTLSPEATYLCVNSKELTFPQESFDRIFLLGTIEHLYDDEIIKTLISISTLLKPGGQLIINTCTNKLYLKNLTYRLRKNVASFLKLKEPAPPRSAEDEVMHINEMHYFSIRQHIKKLGWRFIIKPQPNPKLQANKLYGPNPPKDFPLRYAPPWKQWFYQTFLFRFPVNLLMARSYLVVLYKN